MKKAVFCAIMAVLALPSLSSASTVTLTAADVLGTSSFDTGGNWSDSTAPHSGNDYVVPFQYLRTPTINGSAYTFAGDSLVITNGGGLIIKSDDSTHVIDDLVLVDGGIIWGGNSGNNSGTVFDGHITVQGPAAPVTTASFSAPGTYHLQLAADDGQVQAVSIMVVDAVHQPNLTVELLPDVFRISWPTNGAGEWLLQSKTNLLDAAWMLVPNVPVGNPVNIPIDTNRTAIFYRLRLQ